MAADGRDEQDDYDRDALLSDINERLDQLTSFRWNFLLGLVRGVGTAIGATVIAAILIGWLGWFLENTQEVPVVDQVLERSGVRRSLEGEL